MPIQTAERRLTGRLADAAMRLAFRAGYRGALLWWALRRPRHVGALVALWSDGRVLLVRSSYRSGIWELPGGGARAGESPAATAVRECAEEIGLRLDPAALRLAGSVESTWEKRPETIHIFEAALASEPLVTLDDREIVEAEFLTAAEALRHRLPPHLRAYLEAMVDPVRP
jgi:8-oxo-dGTP diphosphatase